MPHGHCYLWTPPLLWIDVISDCVIGASYFSIPIALWVFARKRKDLPYRWVFGLFGVFVIACGSTHLFDAWNVWHTAYWADAGALLITAITSAATAIILWYLMPHALLIPSRSELAETNQRLANEVARREKAESALREANKSLKHDIAARSMELAVIRNDMQQFQAFLAAIVQSSDDAIIGTDIDGSIISWNPGAERLYGYSAEEAAGQSVKMLEPPEKHGEIQSFLTKVGLTASTISGIDTKRVRKDGTKVEVLVSVCPIRTASEGIIGVASIARNIHEHKLLERNLRAESEKFQGIVEQSLAGIYMVQDGRFVFVNARGAEIIGAASNEEVIGTDPLKWVAENDKERIAEYMRELVAGQTKNLTFEFEVLRRDGTVVDVGINAARATHEGQLALVGLLQDISEKKRAAEEIEKYVGQLETTLTGTIQVVTKMIELRDPYTAGHENRVAELAGAIAAELGLDDDTVEGLRVAGQVHDIGKITIPAEILAKPTRLTPMEYDLIKAHPSAGYEILKYVEFPWPVALVALQHHERSDGSGYPQGLKGDEILLEARITAVADVVEAMASHRPYRPGKGLEPALAEIERGRGQIYDAEAVDACLHLFREKNWKFSE